MKKGYMDNLIYKKTNWIVFFLLFILALQAIFSMQKKSMIIDEHGYLPSGYTHLKTGQLFVIGHTPLVPLISSLPLLFLDLEIPPTLESRLQNNYYSYYSDDFFYVYNEGKLEQILFWGRIPIVFLSALLGLFVFRWAKEIYGVKAGLFALFLYSFNPTILANSRFAVTDMGYSCFMFIALYYFWRFVNNKTSGNLLLSGITFGLAQVSKFTAIYLIPIYLILMFFLFFHKKINKLKDLFSKKILKETGIMLYSFAIILIIGLIIINLTYGFQGSFSSLGENLRNDNANYFDQDVYNTDSIVDKLSFENKIIKRIGYFAVEKIPIMVPYLYLKATVSIIKQVSSPTPYKYFMGGDVVDIWYSYIAIFLVKTPIPIIILLFLSLVFFRRIKSKDILNEYFLLIPVIFTFTYFSFFPFKAVLSYILPVYPFIFVFISKIINLKIKKQILLYFGIGMLCLWYLFSSVSVYPHYLAYFNEFLGGPNEGYKYLVGSNLDLGQDLKGLSVYVKENNIKELKLAYSGIINPDYYGIPHQLLKYFRNNTIENCSKQEGIIAISATYLQGVGLNNRTCFQWLKKYEPVEKIGYSILIYDISKEGGMES